MVRNNHSNNHRKKLDELLRTEEDAGGRSGLQKVLDYAGFLAQIEKVLVVVSDMADGRSHIIAGAFADSLGLGDYHQEDSIWEKRILSLMSPAEQEEKYIAELRYFHYLRHIPKERRGDYFLMSRLRFRFADGNIRDVLHRMYYIFDGDREKVRYAVCIYGPLPFDFSGKSYAVSSLTGITEELTASADSSVMSSRERQVLSLIDTGMKSAEIAARLNISIHTVSRHRQEIIARLQVRNSHEACRIAKLMGLI